MEGLHHARAVSDVRAAYLAAPGVVHETVMNEAPMYHDFAICRWCKGRFVRHLDDHWLCESESCAARQLARVRRHLNGSIRYLPTPAQVDLELDRTPNLLWGGAAGVAKTRGLREDAYQWCKTIPNYEVLLLRRTFPELEETHLLAMQREADELEATYKPGEKRLTWENGSFIKAGHCQDPKDYLKLLSREYDHIILDEAVTFEGKQVLEISSRARSAKRLVEERGGPFVRIGSNPGGPGHLFLLDFFIDKTPNADEYPNYDSAEYAFQPGLYTDNPYLSPRYLKRLKQLEPARRKQLLEADWTVFSGQYFENFSKTTHMVAAEPR